MFSRDYRAKRWHWRTRPHHHRDRAACPRYRGALSLTNPSSLSRRTYLSIRRCIRCNRRHLSVHPRHRSPRTTSTRSRKLTPVRSRRALISANPLPAQVSTFFLVFYYLCFIYICTIDFLIIYKNIIKHTYNSNHQYFILIQFEYKTIWVLRVNNILIWCF